MDGRIKEEINEERPDTAGAEGRAPDGGRADAGAARGSDVTGKGVGAETGTGKGSADAGNDGGNAPGGGAGNGAENASGGVSGGDADIGRGSGAASGSDSEVGANDAGRESGADSSNAGTAGIGRESGADGGPESEADGGQSAGSADGTPKASADGSQAAGSADDTSKSGADSNAKADDSGPASDGKWHVFGRKKEKKDPRDQKIEELTDQLRRQMAEFDNFRKRTEKEKSAMFEVGAKSIIEKLLPVIDNFERGLAAIPEDVKGTPFADGMEMIYKQLLKNLEEAGVKPIEAEGQPFDPNYHNAVMHVEDESLGENVVVQEFQKGYLYRDSVIRHSMVKVAN